MAQQAFAGTLGRVLIPGTPNVQVAGLRQWDVTVAAPTYDASVLGDQWTERISGLKNWTGTLTGYYEVGADPNGQHYLWNAMIGSVYPLLVFESGDGSELIGQAVITQGAISSPVDNVATLTWTFEGNGSLNGPYYN